MCAGYALHGEYKRKNQDLRQTLFDLTIGKTKYDSNIDKSKNMDRGYLLTFDFRQKGDASQSESQWIDYDGKRIFDVVLRVGGK